MTKIETYLVTHTTHNVGIYILIVVRTGHYFIYHDIQTLFTPESFLQTLNVHIYIVVCICQVCSI